MIFSEWIILRTGGQIFYTTFISVDLAHHRLFRATVGKGGIQLFGPNKQYAIKSFLQYASQLSFMNIHAKLHPQ